MYCAGIFYLNSKGDGYDIHALFPLSFFQRNSLWKWRDEELQDCPVYIINVLHKTKLVLKSWINTFWPWSWVCHCWNTCTGNSRTGKCLRKALWKWLKMNRKGTKFTNFQQKTYAFTHCTCFRTIFWKTRHARGFGTKFSKITNSWKTAPIGI